MRAATAFWVLITCAVVTACGDGGESRSSLTTEINIADAPQLFEQDIRRSFEGSYRVAYDLEIEMEGETHTCTVIWWKDGTQRQRFDMCPPLVYGNDFGAEPWRILMFGDREQILVCSSRIPLDPAGELDEGEVGACHEDSFGIGDLAGNAVFYLGFPLEYPDALPPGYFDNLDELAFEKVTSDTIAGHIATCYVVSRMTDEEEKEVKSESCFADNGAVVRRSGDEPFAYTLQATELGGVSAADFELPYPYVDAATD